MAPADINWLGVAAGTLAYGGLGVLWYSRVALRGLWMHAMGYLSPIEIDRDAVRVGWVIKFVTAFVAALALSVLLDWTAAETLAEGALVGGLVAGGFAMTTGAQAIAFEERTILGWLLNSLYNLLGLALLGAVLMYFG